MSNLQPVLPSLWTPHTILLKAHVKELGDSLTVVGHYSQPSRKQELDEELEFAFKLMRQQGRLKQVVLAGDFNRSAEQVSQLAERLRLKLNQNSSHQLPNASRQVNNESLSGGCMAPPTPQPSRA